MFFSERLECSSFDKLLENVSESSRKKFAHFFGICKNNLLCLEQSSQFSSGHLNRSFDNPAETFGESLKIFNANFGKQWTKDFFPNKFPDKFSAGDLECSFDQIVEKILPEVWEILSLSQPVSLFIYFFLTYDLTDHENFLSKS